MNCIAFVIWGSILKGDSAWFNPACHFSATNFANVNKCYWHNFNVLLNNLQVPSGICPRKINCICINLQLQNCRLWLGCSWLPGTMFLSFCFQSLLFSATPSNSSTSHLFFSPFQFSYNDSQVPREHAEQHLEKQRVASNKNDAKISTVSRWTGTVGY